MSDRVTRLRADLDAAALRYGHALLHRNGGNSWDALRALGDVSLEYTRAVEAITPPAAAVPIAPAPLLAKSCDAPDNVVSFPRRRAPGQRP